MLLGYLKSPNILDPITGAFWIIRCKLLQFSAVVTWKTTVLKFQQDWMFQLANEKQKVTIPWYDHYTMFMNFPCDAPFKTDFFQWLSSLAELLSSLKHYISWDVKSATTLCVFLRFSWGVAFDPKSKFTKTQILQCPITLPTLESYGPMVL